MFSKNLFYNALFDTQDGADEACIGGKRVLIRGVSGTGKSSLVFNFARSMVGLGEVPIIIRHMSDFPASSEEQRKKPHFLYVQREESEMDLDVCTELNESTDLNVSPSQMKESIWSAYYHALSLEESRNPRFSLDAMHRVRVFYVDNISDLIELLISPRTILTKESGVSGIKKDERSRILGTGRESSDRVPTILIIEDLSRILDSSAGNYQGLEKLNRLSLASNYIEYAIESITADRRKQTSLSIKDVLHKNIVNENEIEKKKKHISDEKEKNKRRRRSNSNNDSMSNEENGKESEKLSSSSSSSISRKIFNKLVTQKVLSSIASNEEASGVYWPMLIVTDSHQDSRYVDMLMRRLKCSTEVVLTKDHAENSSYASSFHFPQDSFVDEEGMRPDRATVVDRTRTPEGVKMDVYYRKAYVRRNQQPFIPMYDASLPIEVEIGKKRKGHHDGSNSDESDAEPRLSESKRDLRNHCIKTGSFDISMQQSADVDVGSYLVLSRSSQKGSSCAKK
jgi:hypothetical protein